MWASVGATHRLCSCDLWALECRLNGFGAQLHTMWDLPGPGIKPMCPELAGGFCTPEPPGKPYNLSLANIFTFIHHSF